jgi:DNA-directed RNA polymerase subunit RPC12/RpoP
MGARRRYDDEDDYDRRRGFRCPYCGTDEPPIRRSRVSTGGWIVFVALLFVCLPLFWVGLLMTEEYTVCYDCGIKLGGG